MNGFPEDVTALTDVLAHWADQQPNARAYVFLKERGGEDASLTFGELKARANTFAARIARARAAGRTCDPLVSAWPRFHHCLLRLLTGGSNRGPADGAAADERARFERRHSRRLRAATAHHQSLRWRNHGRMSPNGSRHPVRSLLTDAVDETDTHPSNMGRISFTGATISLFCNTPPAQRLTPKGVMVSHGNLIENLEMIRRALGRRRGRPASAGSRFITTWGLILNALALALCRCKLCADGAGRASCSGRYRGCAPSSHYRAEVAGAPNFAYDLCVSRFREEQVEGLDLSSWKVAYNAAEPVRADTFERFAAKFAPYGLRSHCAYARFTDWPRRHCSCPVDEPTRGPVTRTVSRASSSTPSNVGAGERRRPL